MTDLSDTTRMLSDIERELAAINDTLWEIEKVLNHWASRFHSLLAALVKL